MRTFIFKKFDEFFFLLYVKFRFLLVRANSEKSLIFKKQYFLELFEKFYARIKYKSEIFFYFGFENKIKIKVN